jgi:glycosyltransferase involved in cell wall biosynthesis
VDADRLRVLVVATKAPFSSTGGGSVSLHGLLHALHDHGVDVRVVAPGTSPASISPRYPHRCIASQPRSWVRVLPSLVSGRPLIVARYRLPALERAVEEEITHFAPNVVHLEQLHLAWLIPRIARTTAVVLRQQNVESLLLARLAELLPAPLRWAARLESRQTARFEAAACTAASIVAAISRADAARLRSLAPRARVEVLPASFMPDVSTAPRPLRGSPPFLCLGSFDWLPNRDGVRWLIDQVWPRLRLLAPGGVLHVAGPGSRTLGRNGGPFIERYGRVESAASLYDPRGVVLIPLRAGSGVRIRLVEAWAAGVPAVTSPLAAEGLVTGNGDGALVASAAQEFASAAARLAEDPDLRRQIVERGRAKLTDHDCNRVAVRARQLYLQAIEVRCI